MDPTDPDYDPTDPAHLQTLDPADPAHPANQNQIFGTPGFQPSQENIDNYTQEFLETHWVPSHHYTYFEVPPPENRRLQCICAHEASLDDFENRPDDYEAPDEVLFGCGADHKRPACVGPWGWQRPGSFGIHLL